MREEAQNENARPSGVAPASPTRDVESLRAAVESAQNALTRRYGVDPASPTRDAEILRGMYEEAQNENARWYGVDPASPTRDAEILRAMYEEAQNQTAPRRWLPVPRSLRITALGTSTAAFPKSPAPACGTTPRPPLGEQPPSRG
ncbi:hypothetical protein ACU686_43080 [Yinghuangia aomiensis]